MPDLSDKGELVRTTTKEARVTPEQIFKDVGINEEKGVDLLPIQKAGLNLIYFVGAAIIFVIIVLSIDWFLNAPHLPSITTMQESGNITETISSYKSLVELSLSRFTSIFELVVVKALLPIFTTILGYIFGTRSQKVSDE